MILNEDLDPNGYFIHKSYMNELKNLIV